MDPVYGPLAVYNAERARGIVHTSQYDAQMAELQKRYDAWLQRVRITVDLGDGKQVEGYMRTVVREELEAEFGGAT